METMHIICSIVAGTRFRPLSLDIPKPCMCSFLLYNTWIISLNGRQIPFVTSPMNCVKRRDLPVLSFRIFNWEVENTN